VNTQIHPSALLLTSHLQSGLHLFTIPSSSSRADSTDTSVPPEAKIAMHCTIDSFKGTERFKNVMIPDSTLGIKTVSTSERLPASTPFTNHFISMTLSTKFERQLKDAIPLTVETVVGGKIVTTGIK
jgi:hypothetical protein